MEKNPIHYRDLPTWKYQLLEKWRVGTGILGWDITAPYELGKSIPLWLLYHDGLLIVNRGYAWDGPSGPTIDTKNFMRGSVVHDVLYQAIQLGLLPFSYRQKADKELDKLLKEDGMSWLRRKYVYRSLRLFGGGAAKSKGPMKVLTAP